MKTLKNYRWRKTTDVKREFAVYELLADEVAILDAGFSDKGVFEVAFNDAITGSLIEWEQLRKLIDEGQTIAECDSRPA
ncbi:hypothetical protein KGO5_04702 [Sinorhizobium sp. KGO-5]|jgi:hypothetical protein|uniref:hypothetical protein n=1 Tax=Sinorhizobium sp. KGO-5 TaxID=1470810 RepID=UPI002949BDD3|nr:hypothetical protein KGO5_04702 [Sinorhizobium sp. KGO-5]